MRVIVQPVNCLGLETMFSLSLYNKYPHIKNEYSNYIKNFRTPLDRLGLIQRIQINDDLLLINLFSQTTPDRDNWIVLLSSLKALCEEYELLEYTGKWYLEFNEIENLRRFKG